MTNSTPNRIYWVMKEPTKPTEKAPEPKSLYGGYKTKEERDERRREFSAGVIKSGEDWLAKHGPGHLPKVY